MLVLLFQAIVRTISWFLITAVNAKSSSMKVLNDCWILCGFDLPVNINKENKIISSLKKHFKEQPISHCIHIGILQTFVPFRVKARPTFSAIPSLPSHTMGLLEKFGSKNHKTYILNNLMLLQTKDVFTPNLAVFGSISYLHWNI